MNAILPVHMDKRISKVTRTLSRPFVGYFDRRFQDMHDRLDSRVDQLAAQVSTEVECVSEMTLGMQRFVDLCERRVDDTLAAVGELVATFEDRTTGPRGPDPSLVEIPFAVAALAEVPFPARVVQVGENSNLALLLAYLGHSVTVVGAQHFGASHPNVTVVPEPIADWAGPAEPVDLILGLPVDLTDLDVFRRWLTPKGQLVLSSPVGHQAIGEMLGDWDVIESLYYRWVEGCWQPGSESSSREGSSLLLLRAAHRP